MSRILLVCGLAVIISFVFVSPAKCAEDSFQVESYYGDYDATRKKLGFPSESLAGPKLEEWSPPGKAPKKYKIGVLFPHLKDPYWLAVNFGIISEAKKLGVGIKLLSAGGYGELKVQKEQFEQLIEEKVDGIILASIDYTAMDSFVEEAVNKGIPVIEVINDIYAPKIQAKALVSFYEMGYRAGEFVVEASRDKKRITVAFFPGPIGSGWAPDTLKGFFEVQRKNPGKIKLLPPKWGDTGYKAQRPLVEEMLQEHPDIDFIVANAVAAEVAVDILKEMGLNDNVKIVATYIIPTIYDEIKGGLIKAAPSDVTVAQGEMSVDMMVRLLNGEKAGRDFPFRAGPLIPIVTEANIEKYSYESFFGKPGFKPVFDLEPQE